MLKGVAGKRKKGICNIAEVMSVYIRKKISGAKQRTRSQEKKLYLFLLVYYMFYSFFPFHFITVLR